MQRVSSPGSERRTWRTWCYGGSGGMVCVFAGMRRCVGKHGQGARSCLERRLGWHGPHLMLSEVMLFRAAALASCHRHGSHREVIKSRLVQSIQTSLLHVDFVCWSGPCRQGYEALAHFSRHILHLAIITSQWLSHTYFESSFHRPCIALISIHVSQDQPVSQSLQRHFRSERRYATHCASSQLASCSEQSGVERIEGGMHRTERVWNASQGV
jgi:hypothetical protein